MAVSRLKLLRLNSRSSRSLANSNMTTMSACLCSSFCTMTDSPKVDNPEEVNESPELPIWVTFLEKDSPATKDLGDDFVLPSISYWVENKKLREAKGYTESKVSDMTNSDVCKVTNVLMKPFESPDAVVQALNDCDVTASESLVVQMLKRFDNNWKSGFSIFIWAKSQFGSRFSPDTYDLLIDCLGKSKKFDLMWQIVEEMDQMGESYVTLNTMTKIIRRLAKAGRYEDAIDAFRRIEQFGVKKDLPALNILLDALVKEKNVERAYDMFLEFKNEILPNLHTFNTLIHGWSKSRQIAKAQSTMEEMKKHGIRPNVISYTTFIEAYCHEKDFRKVHDILEEMQEVGCPPNVVTYTIVMHALGKSKQIDEALKVYEKMKMSGCVPDSSFYSSLIHILSKAGRLKDARELFDAMPSEGIKRDVLTYNTMISIACEHAREEDALKLLREMETSGVKPDFDTYVPLLKMCCKLKRMKVLSFLLSHMLENDVSVGVGTYSLLIHGLCKSGKLEYACLFLEDAVVKGFVLYNATYKLLKTELEKKGMRKEKERIHELMLVQSVPGDT